MASKDETIMLKNNDQRKQFVNDDANWKQSEELIDSTLRVQTLTYKGHVWTRVQRLIHSMDYWRTHDDACVTWMTEFIYKPHGTVTEQVGVQEVIKELKDIDKKEKEENKK
jgi:hypothetical protein